MPHIATSSVDSVNGDLSADKSKLGAKFSLWKDDNGNTVTPAFSPSLPSALTATASSARISIGSSRSVRITGDQVSAARFRIVFGDALVTASSTIDLPIRVIDPPEKFYIPSGATYMAYIRDSAEASNVLFNITLG